MNLPFGTALIQSQFKLGFFFHSNLLNSGYDDLVEHKEAYRGKQFCQLIKKDVSKYLGLSADLAKEQKNATRLLNIDQNEEQHIKQYYKNRIDRKKIQYDMFIDMFLSYMNNLIYSTYDIENLIDQIQNENMGNYEKHFTQTGITALEAFEDTKRVFSPLLAHIKSEIESEYPIHQLEQLGR